MILIFQLHVYITPKIANMVSLNRYHNKNSPMTVTFNVFLHFMAKMTQTVNTQPNLTGYMFLKRQNMAKP